MAQSQLVEGRRRMASEYKFEGHVIRLSAKDYDLWTKIYHGIPDLNAELYNLDLFYKNEIDTGKDMKTWYFRTSSYLNRKHQEYLIKRAASLTGLAGWKTDTIQ